MTIFKLTPSTVTDMDVLDKALTLVDEYTGRGEENFENIYELTKVGLQIWRQFGDNTFSEDELESESILESSNIEELLEDNYIEVIS